MRCGSLFGKVSLFLIALTCASCMPKLTQYVTDINPDGWSDSEVVQVNYQNEDSVSMCEISLILRVERTFSKQKLPLIIETISPDSLSFKESFTIAVNCNDDEAYTEVEQVYRQMVRLDKKGLYHFRFTPLNDDIVVGVCAIGVVVKHDKSN